MGLVKRVISRENIVGFIVECGIYTEWPNKNILFQKKFIANANKTEI
jgi:hypothetical protein